MTNPLAFFSDVPLQAIQAAGNVLNTGFAAYENEKNRDYNRAMSSTSYRRAAADLEAAGLNRVLALGSPSSGSAPSMMSYPDFGGGQTQAHSAKSAISLQAAQAEAAKESAQLLRDQQVNTQADTAKKQSEKALVDENIVSAPVIRLLTGAQTETERKRPGLVSGQTSQALSSSALNAQNTRLQSYEADKQSVVKRAYRIGGPIIDWLMELGKSWGASAPDFARDLGAGSAAGGTRANPRGSRSPSQRYGRSAPRGGR